LEDYRAQEEKARQEMEAAEGLITSGLATRTPEEIYQNVQKIYDITGLTQLQNEWNSLNQQIASLPGAIANQYSLATTGVNVPKEFIDAKTNEQIKTLTPLLNAIGDQMAMKEAMVKTIMDEQNVDRSYAEKKLDDYVNLKKLNFQEASTAFQQAYTDYKDNLKAMQAQVKENLEMGLKYPMAGIQPGDDLYTAYTKALPYAYGTEAVNLQKKQIDLLKSQVDLQKSRKELEAYTANYGDDPAITSIVNRVVFAKDNPLDKGLSQTALYKVNRAAQQVFDSMIPKEKSDGTLDTSTAFKIFDNAWLQSKAEGTSDPSAFIESYFADDAPIRAYLLPEQVELLKSVAGAWQKQELDNMKKDLNSSDEGTLSKIWNRIRGSKSPEPKQVDPTLIINQF
jgi:hypothetical protein